jgi:hypothetical protein
VDIWSLSDEEWDSFLCLLDRPTIEAWLVSLAEEKKKKP